MARSADFAVALTNGKIDMVAALINAVCLMQIDELDGAGDFFVQS